MTSCRIGERKRETRRFIDRKFLKEMMPVGLRTKIMQWNRKMAWKRQTSERFYTSKGIRSNFQKDEGFKTQRKANHLWRWLLRNWWPNREAHQIAWIGNGERASNSTANEPIGEQFPCLACPGLLLVVSSKCGRSSAYEVFVHWWGGVCGGEQSPSAKPFLRFRVQDLLSLGFVSSTRILKR